MKNCCNSSCIVAHLFFIIGAYILTWGLIGSGSFGAVLKSPVFLGNILNPWWIL